MAPTQTINRQELAKLDTPDLVDKSAQVWSEVKSSIPAEHRESFSAILGSMAERLTYASQPSQVRDVSNAFTS